MYMVGSCLYLNLTKVVFYSELEVSFKYSNLLFNRLVSLSLTHGKTQPPIVQDELVGG